MIDDLLSSVEPSAVTPLNSLSARSWLFQHAVTDGLEQMTMSAKSQALPFMPRPANLDGTLPGETPLKCHISMSILCFRVSVRV